MSLSRSSSQNVGKNLLKIVTPYQYGSSQQDPDSKEQSPQNKPYQFGSIPYQKGEQHTANTQIKINDKKVSTQVQDGDSQVRNNSEATTKQKAQNSQKDISRENIQNKQKTIEVNESNKGNNINSSIKQNDKKQEDKSNIEFKRLFDILYEDNANKQKKIIQLNNVYQSGSIVVQEKEKDPLADGIKLKSLKGIVSQSGEKSEDIIQRTITQKKAELEIMENQIQEQLMYNQTLNFMSLRTDITLKNQKKLVLKMEKLNKIVEKRENEYSQILQEHSSQQQLVQFKMAEQVAKILNKQEIYQSIDQSRMKLKKTQNEDFNKLTQEQEEISKQIAIHREKVEEQEKLITELNQVATNVTNLKMSFPYTFQKAEAMLYIVKIFTNPNIEGILGNLFYASNKQGGENKSLIMDSYLKIPLSHTTNNSPVKSKTNQQRLKGSLNQINNAEDKKLTTRYEYRHQISNSFIQSSNLMKDQNIFIRILEIIKSRDKKIKDVELRSSSNNLSSKSYKKQGKKGRPSFFIKKQSSLNSSSDAGASKKMNSSLDPSHINSKRLSQSIIGERQFTILQRIKDKFLNQTKKYNPKLPDFEYRFVLRDLSSLDSKSNRYMQILVNIFYNIKISFQQTLLQQTIQQQRIQKFEKAFNTKIDDFICNLFQQITNKFISTRSIVSLKVQEKNVKFEKNKKLKKKLTDLKIQFQKKYEITDNTIVNSSQYISEMQDKNQIDDDEYSYEQEENSNNQNSTQLFSERDQRNIRLMKFSQSQERSPSSQNTPLKQQQSKILSLFYIRDECKNYKMN